MGLTKGQQAVLEEVKKGSNVFITGSGGVGKSYIVNYIVTELEASGKLVIKTASTGKAAMLIDGVTCHRAFNIPLKATWLAIPYIRKVSPIYEADAILIDEVSMLRIDAFEYIIESVERVNEIRTTEEYLSDPNNIHRSPIQMIVVGDFCQLPPVIIHPNDESPDEGDMMSEYYGFDVGPGFAFAAPGWTRSHFVTCELTEVMRQSDKPMIDALNGIRFGDRSALSYFKENKRKRKFSPTDGDVIYLCGKNKTAERINNTALATLPEQEYKYYAKEEGDVKEQDRQAPRLLRLKTGAHVIMIQNTDKYRNGSSGTITATYEDSVSVLIHETGEEIDVPYTTWGIERYIIREYNGKKKLEKELIGSFSQLPLRLGYAITIHKSQGQTFDKAVLVLGSDDKKENAKSTHPEIFSYGQLYVALSRVKSMDNLYIEGNLDLVDKLASPEVLEFYGVTNAEKVQQHPAPTIEKTPDTKQIKNTEVEKKKAAQDFATIHCTDKNVSVAWIFAHTLSPDAVRSGTDIQIPIRYCKQAERFINTLPK